MPRKKKKNEEKVKDLMEIDTSLDDLNLDEFDDSNAINYGVQINCPHCKKLINISMMVSKPLDISDLDDYFDEDDMMIDNLRSSKK